MRPKVLRRASTAALVLAVTGLVPGASSGATEDVETVVWLAREGPNHWSDGPSHTYLPGDAEIAVEGDDTELVVMVGEFGRLRELVFAAPRGEHLTERTYEHVTGIDAREDGRAGMRISGDGWTCDDVYGEFTVRRIVMADDGTVSSLWVVFEHRCGRWPPSTIGEVRFRVPGDGNAGLVSAREVAWGTAERGQNVQRVPVTVLNQSGGELRLGTPTLEGPDVSAFRMNARDCSGRALPAGESCTIWVNFLTTRAGPRVATLVIPDAGGVTRRTSLSGSVYSGTTRFVLSSHPDEYVGDGRFFDFTPANARFVIRATPSHVDLLLRGDIEGHSQVWWMAIEAPDGEVFEPGRRYTNAPQAPASTGDEPGWGLIVEGDGRACLHTRSDFTVSEIEFDEFGDLVRFGVAFVQRCEGSPMRGLLDFRAADAHALPKRPPPFHDRLLFVMHHGKYIEGGFDRQWTATPKVCWFRVPIHIYNEGTNRRLGSVRTNRYGNFRWKVPGLDDNGMSIPLEVIAPVIYLQSGRVCAKAIAHPV